MATVGRMRTVWTGVAGSPYYTNLHFLTNAVGNGLQDAAQAWADFLQAHTTNFVSDLTPVIEPDIPLIDTNTNTMIGSATVAPPAITTAGGGEALPRFTQLLIRLETGTIVAGRRLRGRIFLPGMQETLNTTQGVPSGTLIASINASLVTLLQQVDAPLAVYGPTHFAYAEVNSATAWTQWAVLRSRRD